MINILLVFIINKIEAIPSPLILKTDWLEGLAKMKIIQLTLSLGLTIQMKILNTHKVNS